jgi:hypothetical protein
VTWIGAVYAFCWGVYTYGDKKEQSNKEPFLKEQLKLCFRASELARTSGKVALQGIYLKSGAVERLFPSPMAVVLATQGSTSASSGVGTRRASCAPTSSDAARCREAPVSAARCVFAVTPPRASALRCRAWRRCPRGG